MSMTNELNLPWLASQRQKFVEQSQQQRLPHALLVNGPAGVGKDILVKGFAAYQICEQRATLSQACGQCKQCKLFSAGSHTDVRFIAPEDGSSVIKIDAIRNLVEFLSQSSMQGGFKVAVISPAEAMNHNAANAVLKTLEEPTPNTLIILVSHSAGKLLPTIRSRCQAIDVGIPAGELVLDWLKADDSAVYGKDELTAALDMSYGSPLKALEYIDSGAIQEMDAMLGELSQVLKREKAVSFVAERWGDELAIQRLTWMCQWLEQIVQYRMTERDVLFRYEASKKMFRYLSGKVDPEIMFDLHRLSLEQLRLLQGKSNPNKVLVFELLLNRWVALMLKS